MMKFKKKVIMSCFVLLAAWVGYLFFSNAFTVVNENERGIHENSFQIENVLNRELFEVSSKANEKLVYIFLIKGNTFEKKIERFNVNEKLPKVVSVSEGVESVYLLFPENATEKAITVPIEGNATEEKLYERPKKKNRTKYSTLIQTSGLPVGGELNYRIFKIESPIEDGTALTFKIYGEFLKEQIGSNSEVYGTYRLVLNYGTD